MRSLFVFSAINSAILSCVTVLRAFWKTRVPASSSGPTSSALLWLIWVSPSHEKNQSNPGIKSSCFIRIRPMLVIWKCAFRTRSYDSLKPESEENNDNVLKLLVLLKTILETVIKEYRITSFFTNYITQNGQKNNPNVR